MYNTYKNARNTAWKTLIDCNINKLPVDLASITRFYGIQIAVYSSNNVIQAFKEEVLEGDGFSATINNQNYIFLNDKIKNRARRRFTLAHEIGHIVMKHPVNKIHFRNSEYDNFDDLFEYAANVFARDILMPACVLYSLNIKDYKEIQELCDTSTVSSKIRQDRLQVLYERKKFFKHPLEAKVFKQFEDFINENKN